MRRATLLVREFHEAGGLPVDHGLHRADRNDDTIVTQVGLALQAMSTRMARHGRGSKAMRARLLLEELGELLVAAGHHDEVGVADGLADLAYVTAGTAVEWGIPLGPVFEAVHTSNMSKFPPCPDCNESGLQGPIGLATACEPCGGRGRHVFKDAHGKVAKPPTFQPPNIAAVLDKHRAG
jgi:phosphoribosyl-ATP pyrophosphohydrolase